MIEEAYMFFDIMSERAAIAFSHDRDILPTAIISIRDEGEPLVSFTPNPNILAVLHLNFYDSTEERYGSMTSEQADSVVEFVSDLPEAVEQIVIHCTEGISRSAAVCASLMRYFEGDDSLIWNDKRYHPNTRCYRLMLAAINRSQAKSGRPQVFGRVYKGAFWFRSLFELIPAKIPCDIYGSSSYDYTGEDITDPKRAWRTLPEHITKGRSYNSYPHGHVEVSGGAATVFIDRCLDDPDSKKIITDSFLLYPECGICNVEFEIERKKLFGIF